MNNNREKQKSGRLGLMVVILAVFLIAVIIIVSVSDKSRKNAVAAAGADYIRTMEAKDAAAIEDSIFQASRQKMIDEMLAQLDADPDAVWRMLGEFNTVMLGDSRVVGFDIFEFLDPSHVIAAAGATIRTIPDAFDTLSVLNPNLVVLSYGINDINNYWLWETLDEYIAELNQTMEDITALLPNAYIYVQSIIPATEVGLETSPSWGAIPDWNAAIRADCEEHGWRYLDVTDIAVEHSDLYDIDGVHLQYSFYPYWGEAILMQYLRDSGAI